MTRRRSIGGLFLAAWLLLLAAPAVAQEITLPDGQKLEAVILGDGRKRQAVTVPDDGDTIFRRISTADTNGQNVKSAAGVVYAAICTNTHATQRAYLKLYNAAGTPTVGTDTPVMTLLCTSGDGGISPNFGANGAKFATGIGIGITTGVADSDTGAVGANDVVVHVLFR